MHHHLFKTLLILYMLPLSFALSADTDLQFQLDLGGAAYLGDFAEHLETSGAYLYSPTLDGTILIYPWQHFGVGLSWGSMAVIHRKSEPIEGILRYQSLMLEYQQNWKDHCFYLSGGFGFQDPGMQLQWYGSGVWELGLRYGYQIDENLSLTLLSAYRSSFLRSIIIYKKYDDIDENDTLSSLRISLGLRYCLKKNSLPDN